MALYKGLLEGPQALLFGSFLGITTGQVAVLAVAAGVVLAVLGVIGRPLLFAAVDPQVAAGRGGRCGCCRRCSWSCWERRPPRPPRSPGRCWCSR
ncbi:ABC-type Mn2+/Zn2+ transport system permease subunit [Streptacidiphilus sp. EB129]